MWANAELTVDTLRGEAATWHPSALFEVSLRGHFARYVEDASACLRDADGGATTSALVDSLREPLFDGEWRVHMFVAAVLARATPPRPAAAAVLFEHAFRQDAAHDHTLYHMLQDACRPEGDEEDGEDEMELTAADLKRALDAKVTELDAERGRLRNKALSVVRGMRPAAAEAAGARPASPSPPELPATKRPRLVEPLPVTTALDGDYSDKDLAVALHARFVRRVGDAFLLQKSLFLVDVVLLRLHGKRVCMETPLAYSMGPLYPAIYGEEKDVWRPSLKAFVQAQRSAKPLPPVVARAVDAVATFVLGMRSYLDVVELLHTQDVWRHADDRAPIPVAAMHAAYCQSTLPEGDQWLVELCALVKGC